MDEVIGALFRGVLWLAGQAVQAVAEVVVSDLAEGGVKAGKRRFAALRGRRKAAAQPDRVSLVKDRPAG